MIATAPIEIVELVTSKDPIPFAQNCIEGILCDFKINYKYSDTEEGDISYDGGVTGSSLPFGNFAVQTPATVRADIEPTLPVNVTLVSVVKNETLILFELVFRGEENVNIVMNGALGETVAEKCNCSPGWLGEDEEVIGKKGK